MRVAKGSTMPCSESLLARIRAEYREMPGLCLTLSQACRLWHVHRDECERIMDALVAEQFLRRTPTGAFIGTSGRQTVRPSNKAALPPARHQRSA